MTKKAFWIILILFALIVYICYPKSASIEVTGVSWKCEVQIQELQTVKDSDWMTPNGARVYSENSEVQSYIPMGKGVLMPVYATKYYYYIERWVENRIVETSGMDKSPYYGEVELAQASGEYGTGEEREAERTTTHIVTGKVNGEYKNLIVDDESWWKEIKVGDKIDGDITYNDHLIRNSKNN